jgi:DNA polymerase-3 subunit epsilon
MLRFAPKFYEVAKRIIEITEGCIIVAHNAKFDYRILRTEFDRLGYDFQRQSLCTVELSQKLIPEMPSYSLGKLTKSLGIPLSSRHRAEGDAEATVELLKLLLAKNEKQNLISQHIRNKPKKQVDSKLLKLLDRVPKATGIYFFYDEKDTVIYIGKSKNIHKRVNQHFTNTNPKSRSIQKSVENISYEVSGNELMALLKENECIKKIQPEFNSALTKTKFSHGIIVENDKQGYINFKIVKTKADTECLATFTSLKSAKVFLENSVDKFELCLNKTSLSNRESSCFYHGLKQCKGACLGKEAPKKYNKRAQQLVDRYSFSNKNMLILGKGRETNEKSIVYVKSGEVHGFGYFGLNLQVTNQDVLEKNIEPIEHKRDATFITQGHIRRYPNRFKLVKL